MPLADPEWTVVRSVDLSPSRRRLEFVFRDGSKGHATIDTELDSPAFRQKVAGLLQRERYVAHSPRGPVERPAPAPSPWIES